MSNIKTVDPQTAAEWIDSGKAVLIDVRESSEYARERIAAAELISLSAFRADAVPQDKCASGARSAQAVAFLQQNGHSDVHNLAGGIAGWKLAGLATEL